MKTRLLFKYLESQGYFLKRSNKHVIYSNGTTSIAIPHDKNVSVGTLRDIMKAVHKDTRLANEVMKQLVRS